MSYFQQVHAEIFWCSAMVLIHLFYTAQETMVIMMSESIMDRYLKSVTADMIKNNDRDKVFVSKIQTRDIA
jgi:hypothetical protein